MSVPMPSKSGFARGVLALALVMGMLPSAGCNTYPSGSGSQASGGSDGSQGTSVASDTSETADGTVDTTTAGPGADATSDAMSDSTSTATSGAASDTGFEPDPYPEECYEPQALIDVMSAMTPDGPITIDEAWLGVDACTSLPYVVLVQYPSPETGPAVEVTLLMEQSDPPVPSPYLGVYPLSLRFNSGPVGTIDILEPLDGQDLGMASADRHLHAQLELHGEGWDLSLEVDLLDCGAGDCFCPCR